MNSFQQLNLHSQQAFEYTDYRTPGISTDKSQATWQVLNINTTSINVQPGINITEVINYQTANVRYQVKFITGGANPMPSSTVSWGTLPSGVSLNVINGNTYVLSGINSVSIWNAIKNFTWTIPSNYVSYPLWYLDVSILYTDGIEQKSISWMVYDDRFYYLATLESISSESVLPTRIKQLNASLTAFDTVLSTTGITKRFTASLTATSSVVAEGSLLIAILKSNASMSINATRLIISKDYLANQSNDLFSSQYINDNDANASFELTLTSAIGGFSSDTQVMPVSPWTITGNLSTINTATSNVRFYPTKNSYVNGTFTFLLKKNGSIIENQTVNLLGTNNTPPSSTYTFTTDGTWLPTIEQVLYNIADILIVGGGGGGGIGLSAAGSGGGGGGVKELLNQTFSNMSYEITIGQGGAGCSDSDFVLSGQLYSDSATGGTGGSSSAFGITATGGLGGYSSYTPTSTYTTTGGSSGVPGLTDFIGYTGGTGRYAGTGDVYGAGGGGAGESGQNYTQGQDGYSSLKLGGNGGLGKLSSITNQYYGGGGGGGGYSGIVNLSNRYFGLGKSGGGHGGVVTGQVNQMRGSDGSPNTGGGGGGSAAMTDNYSGAAAGNGGSGIVVIKLH